MNIKGLLVDFVLIFAVTLIVTAAVTLLYSLVMSGACVVDWGTSFRLAIILGIVLTWMNARDGRKQKR